MPLPQLDTPRLLLRAFTMADAPTVQALASAFEIADTTLSIPHPYPEGAAEAFITNTLEAAEAGKHHTFAVVRKADNQVIGCAGIGAIHPAHQRGELAYWIGRDFWGQGYATEAAKAILNYAFTSLNAHKVVAHFMTRNPASGKVMAKLGMTFEATLREHIKKHDKFEDLGMYSILRSEFLAQ